MAIKTEKVFEGDAMIQDEFYAYLEEEGYKKTTQKGAPSIISHYLGAIDKICGREGITWEVLASRLEEIVPRYDIGGLDEEYGNQSNGTPRAALKQFMRFVLLQELTAADSISAKSVMASASSTNPELDRLTIKAIIEKLARSNSTITYGELAKRVGELRGEQISSQSFSGSLGRIQEYCLALGLPSLPVMVVDASGKTRDGFVAQYRSLNPSSTALSDSEIIRKERNACIACRDWQSLYDYIGLSERVPKTVNVMGIHESTPIYKEGERIVGKLASEIKRSPEARIACLAEKGHRCVICGFDSTESYGVEGVIHVHHLNPLAESEGMRPVDPLVDLVPVCPNCHAVIHSKKGGHGIDSVYTLDEVRAMLGKPPLNL